MKTDLLNESTTIIAGTVYVIIDIEFSRLGLIRIDSVDHVLVGLRKSME
ncbi:MAG: hypothetical protein WC405_21545 [Syntrophales bacterium]